MESNDEYSSYNKRKRDNYTNNSTSSQPPKKQFLATSNSSNITTRDRDELPLIPLEQLAESLPVEWVKVNI
jgi:hypothetical protein